MAFERHDLVKETSTTTGTGSLTLAGAVSGFKTFTSSFASGATLTYAIAASNGQYEMGTGTFTAPSTLARTTLIESSTGSFLDLPAGTHSVFCALSATELALGALGAASLAQAGLIPVTQAGHGFTLIGTPVYTADGSTWYAAAADDADTIHTGVIASIDGDDLVIQQSGVLSGITFATLTPGEFYFLADDGSLSLTEGTISAPVLQALTSSSALILPYRASGEVIEHTHSPDDITGIHLPVHGIVPYWVGDSEIGWSAGHAQIQGTTVDYTAGTTGTIGQSDVGLSATGCWLHWLKTDGTIELAQESSGAPTWDSTYWYWRKAADATRRLIGWHAVWDNSGTRVILDFNCTDLGRVIESQFAIVANICRLQSGLGTATSNTMVATTSAITICAPSVCTDALIAMKIQANLTTPGEWVIRTANRDADLLTSGIISTSCAARVPINATGVTGYAFFPPGWINLSPSDKTIYYGFGNIATSPNPNTLLVDICGARIVR